MDGGADTEARDRDGNTALLRAVAPNWTFAKSEPAVVQALLERGADIAAHDERGNTPLHAAIYRHDLEAVEALLAMGADSCVQNHAGSKPLSLAWVFRRRRIRKLIEKYQRSD